MAQAVIPAFFPRGSNETDLSAVENTACSATRVPGAQPHAGRTRCAARASRAGAQAPGRLTPRACVPNAASRVCRSFDRTRRITRRADFERLLKAGKRRSIAGFVFYMAHRDSGPPRLGIVISRRHARLAATRNAIKRYIREAFRLEQAVLGSIDLLVRPPLGARPSPEMLSRLRGLLGRLEDK
jgi:ribonuclease P protein component